MSVYAFDDSGAPSGSSSYTTLVILHGCAFDKGTFKKLLPLAAQHSIRLLLLNRREYSGSKPLAEEDFVQFDGPDEQGHEKYFGTRAQELANFLLEFALKEDLPKASADSAGGIALMGWSAGNAYTLSLLSHADAIAESTRVQLEPFLRTMVIFDAPAYIVGHSLVRTGKFILLDASFTAETRFKLFAEFVGTYFEHRSITSHDRDDLQFEVDPKMKHPLPSTTSGFSADEYSSIIQPEAAMRADIPGMVYPLSEFALWTRRALFDDDFAQKYWPNIKVEVIWCENSVATCVETGWVYEELRKEFDDKGVKGRPLKITQMPGANHFPHWDQPDNTISLFAKVVHGARAGDLEGQISRK